MLALLNKNQQNPFIIHFAKTPYIYMPLSVHASEAFAKHIERCVSVKRMTYMEAIIEFCEHRQLEPESIVPFLNDKIKNALAFEAQRLHLLPKMSALPLD